MQSKEICESSIMSRRRAVPRNHLGSHAPHRWRPLGLGLHQIVEAQKQQKQLKQREAYDRHDRSPWLRSNGEERPPKAQKPKIFLGFPCFFVAFLWFSMIFGPSCG